MLAAGMQAVMHKAADRHLTSGWLQEADVRGANQLLRPGTLLRIGVHELHVSVGIDADRSNGFLGRLLMTRFDTKMVFVDQAPAQKALNNHQSGLKEDDDSKPLYQCLIVGRSFY